MKQFLGRIRKLEERCGMSDSLEQELRSMSEAELHTRLFQLQRARFEQADIEDLTGDGYLVKLEEHYFFERMIKREWRNVHADAYVALEEICGELKRIHHDKGDRQLERRMQKTLETQPQEYFAGLLQEDLLEIQDRVDRNEARTGSLGASGRVASIQVAQRLLKTE